MNKNNIDLSVGFVVTHPYHGSPGSILRVRELSRSLSSFGVAIHVFSPFKEVENWGDNVFFHRLPSFGSVFGIEDSLYGLTRRLVDNPFFVRRVLLNPKTLNWGIDNFANDIVASVDGIDIDVIEGVQEIAATACVRAKEKLGVPVVSSLHNIWPEELVSMNIIEKPSTRYSILQNIEQEILHESDLIIVVSEEMRKYLEGEYCVRKNNITVVPPGGRPRISQVQNHAPPFKVVYAGLVVHRANLDLFIKSMPFILEKYPDVSFYITRKGEDLKRIQRLAKEIGVSPNYYWFSENEAFYKFLASCDVGVITSSNDLPRKLGPAVKLFDYLSVGVPVVANDIGGWTKMIEDEKIGILTDDDPEEFASAILKLLKEDSIVYRNNALKSVYDKLNWDVSSKILLKKYHILCKKLNNNVDF